MSDDSLTVSTAILIASYAVCQPVSLPQIVAPLLGASRVSENAEPMERAIAADVAASAMEFLCEVRSCTRSAGEVGVETESSVGCLDLRERRMVKVDDQVKLIIGSTSRALIDNVTTAPAQRRIWFDFPPRSGVRVSRSKGRRLFVAPSLRSA